MILLLLLLLVLLLAGFGFAFHLLWILALVFLAILLFRAVFERGRR